MTQETPPEGEVRGPPPSVSTPLLFLVLFSVFTAFGATMVLVIPEQTTLRRTLAGITALPLLFCWWNWFRHRASEQRVLRILALAFVAHLGLLNLSGPVLTFAGGEIPAPPRLVLALALLVLWGGAVVVARRHPLPDPPQVSQ